MPMIHLENVSKRYRAERGGRALVGRGGLLGRFSATTTQTISALEDISFAIDAGESVGIIGSNGSGKSTLLKIIAGVTTPTSGTVTVHGRVASLLELGAGFHPMLTGRENVYLNAGIHGMRKAQVDAAFDDIVAFSGIGESIDYPVDTYSSGMYVRIAFAVAVHVNPDVFLIDEVLSVGDEAFQRKCRTRIGELMEQGKTIVFVSHDLGIVNTLCNRVILLSKGRMIARDSAANAINFYLRQVGGDRGVHTLRSGKLEVLLCEGRVSIYYDEQEVTAPAGFQFRMLNLGQWHHSIHGEWTIVEADETSCVARGRMQKLPVTLLWRLRIENGALDWNLAVECEREISIDGFVTEGRFPQDYTQWSYDDETGAFPEIRADDTIDTAMTYPELLCEQAVIAGDVSGSLPGVRMILSSARSNMTGCWSNTGFLEASRQFRVEEYHAGAGGPLTEGAHEILSLRCEPGMASSEATPTRHTVRSGSLSARFDRGRIRLNFGGRQVTTNLHVYGSMLIGNLWTDSTSLRWETFTEDGDALRFGGVSRRFPYRQEWELKPVDDGIALRIWIDVSETMFVQEYQTSVMLVAGYSSWETAHESGVFPAFESSAGDWVHVNKNYDIGGAAAARGDGLPEIRFTADEAIVPSRMTIVNTATLQRGRVLQALCTGERGALTLEPGRHVYFQGSITVADDASN